LSDSAPTSQPTAPVPSPLPEQPAPVAASKKSLGVPGLVLGIIGIVFGFIPGLLNLGILLGILALIFGIVAMRRKTARGPVALVLGIVAIVIGSIFASVYGGGSSANQAASDASSLPAPTASHSEAPSAQPKKSTPAPPAAPAAPALTTSQEQAVIAAKGYLSDGQGFSLTGLIKQLTSSFGSGFAKADALVAIKSLNPDWNAQAVIAAKGYVSDGQGFSHSTLLRQLTSSYGSGFTNDQATYAVSKVGL
jgi:Host cell surface-exposed lipoprotein